MSEQHQNPPIFEETLQPHHETRQDDLTTLSMVARGVLGAVAQARLNRAAAVHDGLVDREAAMADVAHMGRTHETRVTPAALQGRVHEFVAAQAEGRDDTLTPAQRQLAEQGFMPLTDREFVARTDSSGQAAAPKGFWQRRAAKKVDKAGNKKAVNDIYKRRVEGIYKDPVTLENPNPQIPTPPETSPRAAKREVRKDLKDGTISAAEARLRRNEIDARPMDLSAEPLKIVGKDSKKAEKKLERKINPVVGTRVRSARKKHAINTAIKNAERVARYNREREEREARAREAGEAQ